MANQADPPAQPIDFPTFAIAVGLLALIVGAMFILTWRNTVPTREALRAKGNSDDPVMKAISGAFSLDEPEVASKAHKAAPASESTLTITKGSTQGAPRVTRTILAVGGFSLFALFAILTFRLTGGGAAELRSTALGAIAAFSSAASAFYFATRAASKDG